MAKHRKTREEKIRSTQRRELPLQQSAIEATPHTHNHISYTLPTRATTPVAKSANTLSYAYVSEDLRKTLFITGTIIIAQIILFVLLQGR
ncbi:hypothetical protein BH11PAT1_BH11PAT1_5080 [soil metagenome]